MTLPDTVKIVEVGPRDGLQNEAAVVSVDTKVELIERLVNAGLKHVEAGAFVHPKWVPQMADSAQVLSRLKDKAEASSSALEDIHYPVLVPNLRGLEGAMESGAKEIAIFAAASESFTQKNINCSIQESLERFAAVAEFASAANIRIRGYISCVMGCPYEGHVAPEKVVEIALTLKALGCYEISLGDTIGIGNPAQTSDLIARLSEAIPLEEIAVHFHDTYGQALANIYSALLCGVSTIDSSVAGLGGCPYAQGASGNVATEDVVYLLNGLGITHGVDLGALVETGRFICNRLDKPVASKVNLAIAH